MPILTFVRKPFTKEREIIIKQVKFKDKKKALQIAPKRSAVIPPLQKDTPLLPLHKKIRRYCTKVSTCLRYRRRGRRPAAQAPMSLYNVGVPWERVGVDILGPLPPTKNNFYNYVVVFIDYFTRWIEVAYVRDIRAETLANAFVSQVVSRFGLSLELHSDQGRCFESTLFQATLKVLGVHKIRTTPLRPCYDGAVERVHRTIGEHLALLVNEQQDNWDIQLDLFLLAYRSMPHFTTGLSPAQLLTGRTPLLPEDLEFGPLPSTIPVTTVPEYAAQLQNHLRKIHEIARNSTDFSTAVNKHRYDLRVKPLRLQPDEEVWLYNPRRRKGRCPKLQTNWEVRILSCSVSTTL